MYKIIPIVFIALIFSRLSFSQTSFPQACIGEWEGMMMLYKDGEINDSVAVVFTVEEQIADSIYTWRTAYRSPKYSVEKDYILKRLDKENKSWLIDECNGIEIPAYRFENKLYSMFGVQGKLLTSAYSLISNGSLIFEVTSGKKIETKGGVSNYTITVVQKAVLKRKK